VRRAGWSTALYAGKRVASKCGRSTHPPSSPQAGSGADRTVRGVGYMVSPPMILHRPSARRLLVRCRRWPCGAVGCYSRRGMKRNRCSISAQANRPGLAMTLPLAAWCVVTRQAEQELSFKFGTNTGLTFYHSHPGSPSPPPDPAGLTTVATPHGTGVCAACWSTRVIPGSPTDARAPGDAAGIGTHLTPMAGDDAILGGSSGGSWPRSPAAHRRAQRVAASPQACANQLPAWGYRQESEPLILP